MNDDRFGWLGESRRTAIRSVISSEVSEWARAWWIEAALVDADVRDIEHDRINDRRSTPLALLGPSGSMAMFLDSKGVNGIGRHLAGTSDEESAGWAQRIGEDALADLAARICARAGVATPSPVADNAVVPSLLTRADLGSAVMTIALGRLEWTLCIDRQLVDRLAVPRTLPQPPLVSRHSAMAGVYLRVNAIINLGSVNLADLSDLHVGEFLVGDRGLGEALQVHVEGRGAVANGYLRRVGTKRAVLLDGIDSHEEHNS